MMEKTMQINGMMCNHCKMTVEKALKAVPGVENVRLTSRRSVRKSR